MIRRAIFAVVALLAVSGLPWQASGQGASADNSPAIRSGEPREHRVPFQAQDGMIYIQARVNGSRRTLLVDTGATFTILTLKAVPAINLDSPVTMNLAKGSMLASRRPVGFALGDSDHPERHCAFRLDAVVGDFKITHAEGAVGLDILSRFKSVTFDFKNSVMVLEDR
jgi:Aspartyl protease